MGNSTSKQLERMEKKFDLKFDRMEKKFDRMEKRMERMDKKLEKLDRIDNRTAALVEGVYRSGLNCKPKEIVSAYDAICLLQAKEGDISSPKAKLIDHLYRNETRELLDLICPNTGLDHKTEEWEKKAYDLLKNWLNANDGFKESEEYKETSQYEVAKKFADLLKPFDEEKEGVSKKQLHQNAKAKLSEDNSGLTLSLIFSHKALQEKGDESKCWAWRVLDIDGYEIRDQPPCATIVTEIKSDAAGLSTAKKQLKLRAKFLDTVASCIFDRNSTELPQHLCLIAAILKTSYDQENKRETLDSEPYEVIQRVTLETLYFRL